MKRNVVQDVIPPKKSIRNLKISEKIPAKDTKNTSEGMPPREVSGKIPPPSVPPEYNFEYESLKKPGKSWLYGSVAVLIVAGLFGLSAFFKSAQIKLTPKQEMSTLNDTFSAKKDASGNTLGFQLVTTSKDLETTVLAQSEEHVSRKAQGTIIIYNNFGSASQKLVATTRFQTSDGFIFRLINPVTIPGQTLVNGQKTPGSVEAVVEADKPGSTYNMGLKDFTIPGFQGDPRYKQIYARSKTEMTGGFVGLQKVVTKDDLTSANNTLEGMLRASLAKDISSQIPDNFILFSTSLSYKFDPATQVVEGASSTQATIKKRGVATGIIIDKGALTRAIATKLLPDITSDIVKITNLDSLEFGPSTFNPATDTTLNFNLKGDVNFVWVFDENKLKSDLLGLSKSDARSIISTYGSIKEAWIETHPFWNQTIPKDASKVTLLNTLTK